MLKKNSQSNLEILPSHRIVVKIGTKLLIDSKSRKINTKWFESFVKDVTELIAAGKEIAIVCSGSTALGLPFLKSAQNSENLEDKQAASAIGRIQLINLFQTEFQKFDLFVSQILLSLSDTETRRRHLNARATINALFRQKIIPIIFENGTVSTTELREGDNDILAAHIAQTISADTLILFSSSKDGIYETDPKNDDQAKILEEIIISDEKTLESLKSNGKRFPIELTPKIEAAEIAAQAGCNTYFTKGKDDHSLQHLFQNKEKQKTLFSSSLSPTEARQKWIASHLLTSGGIIVSETGIKLIINGKGLHPKHILSINGIFQRGELISIANQLGQEVARGLSSYCWKDAVRIRGSEGVRVINELGFGGREVMIDSDDLVLEETLSAD